MAVHSKQLLLMVAAVIYIKATTQPMSLPNCPTKCGSVTIPFPFGTTKNCSLDNTFLINCNKTSSAPTSTHVPYMDKSNQSVLNISLNGELHVAWPVASDCYAEKSRQINQTLRDMNMTHFYISPTRNKLTAIGCDTIGALSAIDSGGNNYTTGCVALCNRLDEIVANQSCSGTGCCEIAIPQGRVLREVAYTSVSIFNNHSDVHDFNPCGYSFVVEKGAYSFASTDLLELKKKEFPVLFDWAVGNQTCQHAQNDLSNYACKADKSTCYNSAERSGYLCRCVHGYRGNPYLIHGCQGTIYFFSLVMIRVHQEAQVRLAKFGSNLPTNVIFFVLFLKLVFVFCCLTLNQGNLQMFFQCHFNFSSTCCSNFNVSG